MEQPQPARDPSSAEAIRHDAAANGNEKLPPLSTKDFRIYNRMAEHMDYFHNHFRQTWGLLYDAASSGTRPANLSVRNYLNVASQFAQQLTVHHTIEEQHIFPVLAKKMPDFRKQHLLLAQHAQIHEGLEKLEVYVDECREGKRELRLGEVKELMDGFGEVLWSHLNEEVKDLGAENMRKFWTKEEMMRMPM